ncbi:MAG: hypothetical protein IJY86_05640 [Clostridia bacterium]|nr:hypothetical protein [Clostridia bacterium]
MMSPKELLYVQDALSHEQMMQKKCAETAQRLSDPELKGFVDQMARFHRETFGRFYGLLN